MQSHAVLAMVEVVAMAMEEDEDEASAAGLASKRVDLLLAASFRLAG
jgi:hypothetical protein